MGAALSYRKKDPRDRGYNSVVVVGEYAGGAKIILRRFPIAERGDANAYAMEHHGRDEFGREFSEILVESSRLPCEHVDERYRPEQPFRAEHMRSISFVYDAKGREIACFRGPRPFRTSMARVMLSGVTA